MNDKLGIRVSTVFDYKNGLDELNKILKTLESKVVDIKINFDNTKLAELSNAIKALKINDIDLFENFDFSKSIEKLTEQYRLFGEVSTKVIVDADGELSKYVATVKDGEGITKRYIHTVKELEDGIKELSLYKIETLDQTDATKIKEVTNERKKQLKIIEEEQTSKLKLREIAQKELEAEKATNKVLAERIMLFQADMNRKIIKLETGSLKDIVDKNALRQIRTEMDALTPSTENVNFAIKKLSSRLQDVTNNAQTSSKALKITNDKSQSLASSLVKAAQKFGLWISVTTIFFATVREIKKGLSTIVEFDHAITNLKKVSDELGKSVGIKQFTLDMNNLAISVGHTTVAAIDAVTEFKKLGYSLNESTELAKNALIYSNIGDINIGDATKSITATLAGFNLTAKDTVRIIDMFNEVGNNFSITTGGIGDSLQRSGAALFAANNSLEESIALTVAANAAIQNPEKVGNALKTVAMRIRGISEETGESIPKLDGLVQKLTKVELLGKDGAFKSTYQIMKEISEVFKDMKDTDQARLTEALFGKRQASVGASLLNNMAMGVKSYETALRSAGSAEKEQLEYMNSLNAKINEFKETVKRFWVNLINTEVVKFLLEVGTGLVKVIDLVGVLGISLLILAARLHFVGIAMIENFVTSMLTAAGASVGFASAFAPLVPLMIAITAGIVVLGKAIKDSVVTLEEQRAKVTELGSSIETLQSQIDSLKSSEGELTRADELKLANLERRVALAKELYEIEQATLRDKELKAIDKDIKNLDGQINKLQEQMERAKSVDPNSGYAGLAGARDVQYLIDTLLDLEETLERNKDKLESFKDEAGNLSEEGKKLEQSMKKSEEAISKLHTILGSVKAFNFTKATEDAADSVENLNHNSEDTEEAITKYKEAIESTNKEIDSYQSNLKEVSSIYEQVNNQEKLSSMQLLDLIQKYPQYTAQILNANSSKENGLKLAELLFALEKKSIVAKLLGQKQELEADKKLAESKLKLLNIQYGSIIASGDVSRIEAMSTAIGEAQKTLDEIKSIDVAIDLINGMEFKETMASFGKTVSKTSSSTSEKASKSLKDYFNELDKISKLESDLSFIRAKSSATGIDSTEEELALIKQIQNAKHELAVAMDKDIVNTKEQLKTKEGDVELTEKLAELENARVKLSEDWWKLQKEGLDVLEKQTKEIEEQIKKKAESYEKAIKSAIDIEIQGYQDEKDAIEEKYSSIREGQEGLIVKKQQEIDLLKEQHDLEERELERKKKLLAIEEARERLANIQKERNTRILNTEGKWEWVANPKDVKDAQKTLKDLTDSYSEWELKNQRDDNLKKLQDQKKHLENMKALELLGRDDLIKAAKEKLAEMEISESTSYATRIANLANFVNEYNALMASLDGGGINVGSPSSGGGGSGGSQLSQAEIIAQAKADWATAKAAGDKAGMEAAHARADAARGYQTDPSGTYKIDKYASGTDFAKTNVFLAGENEVGKGGELVWGKGSKVLPSDLSKTLLEIPTMFKNFMVNLGATPMRESLATGTTYDIKIDKIETPNAQSFIDLVPTLVKQYK